MGIKLGISNIAWDGNDDAGAYRRLRDLGVSGIEVAPTRIAPWESLEPNLIDGFREQCDRFGLCIPSLQAILYNRPDALLFGNTHQFAQLTAHMETVGRVAAGLGAKVAVFGAPLNRSRGDMPVDEAWAMGVERMRILGEIALANDVKIGIEPIPPHYKGDFLTRIDEVVSFVELCDHPAVRPHFDIGCVTLGGDDPAEKAIEYRGKFVHFHASEPDLAAFDNPVCNHAGVARALDAGDYEGWLVVEMRKQEGNAFSAIDTAIRYVDAVYGRL